MTGRKRDLPFVTAIIPCYNEESFIAECLGSVVAFEYPPDRIEVLVVDGNSTDRTREIAESFSARYPHLRVLDNPKRILAAGWNIGIRSAKGEVVFTLIGHGTYRPDYVMKCVEYLAGYGADCVGGVIRTLPQSGTAMARAIATAMSHRFGVGNSAFRTGCKEPTWDTNIHAAAWRRDVFDKVGYYNEDLLRSQDADFQARFRANGGRGLLVPETFSDYYARSTYSAFVRYAVENGYWVSFPLEYGSLLPALRRWVPMFFVLSLLGSAGFALFNAAGSWLFALTAGSYASINAAVSASIARRSGDARQFLLMSVVFATLHLGYGAGCLVGLLRVLAGAHFRKRVMAYLGERVTTFDRQQ